MHVVTGKDYLIKKKFRLDYTEIEHCMGTTTNRFFMAVTLKSKDLVRYRQLHLFRYISTNFGWYFWTILVVVETQDHCCKSISWSKMIYHMYPSSFFLAISFAVKVVVRCLQFVVVLMVNIPL